MASLERRMVHWVSRESILERIELELEPGEKRVIAVFQDESSFYANKYKQNAWCVPR